MKKKIIGILIAMALLGVAVFQVAPVLADTTGPLDHVTIIPASVTLLPNGTQHFTAQGYDVSNVAIPGLAYFWLVTTGGGTVNSTGLFKAGDTPGTFTETVEVVAVQRSVVKVAYASVTVNATAGPLNHVVITPASASVGTERTKKFSAQGYDAANIAITGMTYIWSVVAGGGTINSSGQFTADTTTGVFANTVQVSTTQGPITKTALASVTVTAAPQPESKVKTNISKLTRLLKSHLNGVGFENFMNGQWTVKENSTVNTYKVISGVVKGVTATTLAVLANSQTTNTDFTLPAGTTILPKGTVLAVDDKVVVVTVNDQVKLVLKVYSPTGTPPGLRKQEKERENGTPSGWEKDKKNGWDKDGDTDTEDD